MENRWDYTNCRLIYTMAYKMYRYSLPMMPHITKVHWSYGYISPSKSDAVLLQNVFDPFFSNEVLILYCRMDFPLCTLELSLSVFYKKLLLRCFLLFADQSKSNSSLSDIENAKWLFIATLLQYRYIIVVPGVGSNRQIQKTVSKYEISVHIHIWSAP